MSARDRKSSPHDAPAITLEALQSRGEKLAEWIGANPIPILGGLAAVLVFAAVVGIVQSVRADASEEAAIALATAQSDFRAAMGARPGELDIAEPANPDVARSARTTFAERFGQIAADFADQPVGALAAIEQGALQQELGQIDAAIATWSAAADRATGTARGMLLLRAAAALESRGEPGEAAARYEAAASDPGFALRARALADAARCRADANESEAAIALLQRLESEAPDYAIPPHIAARVAELRAAEITR